MGHPQDVKGIDMQPPFLQVAECVDHGLPFHFAFHDLLANHVVAALYPHIHGEASGIPVHIGILLSDIFHSVIGGPREADTLFILGAKFPKPFGG